MSAFYSPEGPENQALEAEFPFIFVMLRLKVKLRKGERKALEALSGRVIITTTQDQYANWLKQVMRWRRPGVEVITMAFPKLNVDDHAEGSNASEAPLSGIGRA